MNITPLDITQKQFPKAFRGYEREEVEAFLSLVAVEFEALVQGGQLPLREDNQRKDEELAEHRSRERALQETLVTAQKASEEIRDAARKEAEITIADAELQAEKIVQGAHSRFLRIVDDINELKRQRVQFESTVRMLVESHLKLIEAFQEPTREESVQFMPRRGRRRQQPTRSEQEPGLGVGGVSAPRPSSARIPTSTSSGTLSSPRRPSRAAAAPAPRSTSRSATSSTSSSCTCRSRSASGRSRWSAPLDPDHGDLDDVRGRPLDGRVDGGALGRHPQRRVARADLGHGPHPTVERARLAVPARLGDGLLDVAAGRRRSGRSSGR